MSESCARVVATRWIRSRLVLLGVVVLVLFQAASGQGAGGFQIAWLERMHQGLVLEPEVLHEVLSDLGVVPGAGSGPLVVYLATVDTTVDASGAREHLRDRVMFAVSELAALDAGALSLVTVPWGRLDDRLASGRTFPADDEALLAAGHGFLVGREDVVVTPDAEASVAEVIATRSMYMGLERLGAIDVFVCVDDASVRGWATAFHRRHAFAGSLDVFIAECVAGELRMEPPGSGLGAVTGVEEWHALVFPSAVFGEDTGRSALFVDTVQEQLAIARVPVPVFVLAAPTLSSDGVWVSAEEHAAALAEQGVVVDRELGERLPGWVWELVYLPYFMLLVDPDGAVAGMFIGTNYAGWGTLAGELVRLGLF